MTRRITADTKFDELTRSEIRALALIEFERRTKTSAQHRGRVFSEETRDLLSQRMRDAHQRKREAKAAELAVV